MDGNYWYLVLSTQNLYGTFLGLSEVLYTLNHQLIKINYIKHKKQQHNWKALGMSFSLMPNSVSQQFIFTALLSAGLTNKLMGFQNRSNICTDAYGIPRGLSNNGVKATKIHGLEHSLFSSDSHVVLQL